MGFDIAVGSTMARPGTHNLPAYVRGDTWKGMGPIRIELNGDSPPNALASARIQFRFESAAGSSGPEFSTANEKLTILDADTWELEVPGGEIVTGFNREGTWVYDLETTDAAGKVKTYLAGSLEVIADVSR